MTNPLKKKNLVKANIIFVMSVLMVILTRIFWENQIVLFSLGCAFIFSFVLLSINHNLQHGNIIYITKIKGDYVDS